MNTQVADTEDGRRSKVGIILDRTSDLKVSEMRELFDAFAQHDDYVPFMAQALQRRTQQAQQSWAAQREKIERSMHPVGEEC